MHPSIFTAAILEYICHSASSLHGDSEPYLGAIIKCIHEKPVMHFMRHILSSNKPSQICADIGANKGIYTQLFLDLTGNSSKIYSFEPIPLLADHLKNQYIQHNNVTIYNCALGNSRAKTDFYYFRDTAEHPDISGASGLTPYNGYDVRPDVITVQLEKLDELDIDRVDVMKIDTEGAELDVLKGGIRTIARSRPFISTEFVHFKRHGYSPDDLHKFATSLEYLILNMFGEDITNKAVFDIVKSAFPVMCNVFLIPYEKLSAGLVDFLNGNKTFILEALGILRKIDKQD